MLRERNNHVYRERGLLWIHFFVDLGSLQRINLDQGFCIDLQKCIKELNFCPKLRYFLIPLFLQPNVLDLRYFKL